MLGVPEASLEETQAQWISRTCMNDELGQKPRPMIDILIMIPFCIFKLARNKYERPYMPSCVMEIWYNFTMHLEIVP